MAQSWGLAVEVDSSHHQLIFVMASNSICQTQPKRQIHKYWDGNAVQTLVTDQHSFKGLHKLIKEMSSNQRENQVDLLPLNQSWQCQDVESSGYSHPSLHIIMFSHYTLSRAWSSPAPQMELRKRRYDKSCWIIVEQKKPALVWTFLIVSRVAENCVFSSGLIFEMHNIRKIGESN